MIPLLGDCERTWYPTGVPFNYYPPPAFFLVKPHGVFGKVQKGHGRRLGLTLRLAFPLNNKLITIRSLGQTH